MAILGLYYFNSCLIFMCDWIWDNPPSTHNNYYKYLEMILIIWSIITREGKLILEICQDSIAIYNLSIHQLLGE